MALVTIGLFLFIYSHFVFQNPIQISKDNLDFFKAQAVSKTINDYFDFILPITKKLPPSLDERAIEYFSENRKHPEYMKIINQEMHIKDSVNKEITRANKNPH